MKETKTFFDKNNRLNKGYAKIDPTESDINLYRKKFQNILPPLDLISQYEDIHPGTLNRLIEIIEQEQKNKHELEIAQLKSREKTVKIKKVFALASIVLIAIATVLLWLFGGSLIALVFCCSAFAALAVAPILSCKKSAAKEANIGATKSSS